MRLHHARKHGVSLHQVAASEPAKISEEQLADHYLGGVPTCKHCGAVYSRRQAFRNHILNTCPVLKAKRAENTQQGDLSSQPTAAERPAAGSAAKPAQTDALQSAPLVTISHAADSHPDVDLGLGVVVPSSSPPVSFQVGAPLFRQEFFVQQCQSSWKNLLHNHEVCMHLRSHCIFCNQWCVANAGGMKQHIRRSHPDAWGFLKSAEDACSSVTLGPQPCSYCGVELKQSARRGHLSRCTVIFQLALAFLQLPKASKDVTGRPNGAGGHHLGRSTAERLLSESGGPGDHDAGVYQNLLRAVGRASGQGPTRARVKQAKEPKDPGPRIGGSRRPTKRTTR